VQLTFIRTPDRGVGGLISFGTAIVLLGWTFFSKRTPVIPDQH
jgi:hypothetical protein